jgi:succinate dehydrogenase/fumarate reductase flavoprotein subunit
MATTLEAIVKSAELRKESRGAHYRLDLPETDNKEWLKNVVISNAGGAMEPRLEPVVMTHLKPGKEVL